jgi:peptidoglycan/LPS O-acetylase OafA/YrhL
MRGFAILLVLLTHSFLTGFRPSTSFGRVEVGLEPVVLGGSLGVELFFFISGFVLFAPHARSVVLGTSLPTLGRFVDRRFIKIVPSYTLAVLVSFYLFTQPANVRGAPFEQIVSHLTFTHSFSSNTMFSIDSAFWSLAPEVQFYVLFPALAFLMRLQPFAVYAAALATGEGFRLWLHATGKHGNFFYVSQLPAQIDLFVLGMLCAYLFVKYSSPGESPRRYWPATLIAVGATALGVWLIDDFAYWTANFTPDVHQAWQNDHRLIVSWTIAAFGLGSLFAFPLWRRLVANPPLAWLSVISYNLYLWHEPIVSQCAITGFPCALDAKPWSTSPNWHVQYFVMYVGLSLALASLATYMLERPLLRLGTRGALNMLLRREA